MNAAAGTPAPRSRRREAAPPAPPPPPKPPADLWVWAIEFLPARVGPAMTQHVVAPDALTLLMKCKQVCERAGAEAAVVSMVRSHAVVAVIDGASA